MLSSYATVSHLILKMHSALLDNKALPNRLWISRAKWFTTYNLPSPPTILNKTSKLCAFLPWVTQRRTEIRGNNQEIRNIINIMISTAHSDLQREQQQKHTNFKLIVFGAEEEGPSAADINAIVRHIIQYIALKANNNNTSLQGGYLTPVWVIKKCQRQIATSHKSSG